MYYSGDDMLNEMKLFIELNTVGFAQGQKVSVPLHTPWKQILE